MTIKEIQKIIKEFEESNLTELELEFKEIKLRLSKNKESNITKETQKIVDINHKETDIFIPNELNLPKEGIKSPLVGTFYEASSPESSPFITVGQKINKGDVICIVEAMKIMNEITSNIDGIVEAIHFNNGDVVGFDDVIVTVNTNANSSN